MAGLNLTVDQLLALMAWSVATAFVATCIHQRVNPIRAAILWFSNRKHYE